MQKLWACVLICSLAAVSGCAANYADDEDTSGDATDAFDAPLAPPEFATVADAAGQSDLCSTAPVLGLARELIDEMHCELPGMFAAIDDIPHVQLGNAAFPLLEASTAEALARAVARRPGVVLKISSTIRALPQQYLLRTWFEERTCRIQRAARTDRSNHQSGSAIDIDDPEGWREALEAEGFVWYGAGDRPHFDYPASMGGDLRIEAVKAFQRTWNQANPNDLIDVDGVYGPQTAMRLEASPTQGFGMPPSCFIGPPRPRERVHVTP